MDKIKKVLFFLVKVFIAAAIIYWLVREERLVFSSFTDIDLTIRNVLLVLMGALSVFTGLFLLALRLMLLLKHLQFDIIYPKLLGFTMVGAFLGTVLPGLVGGDAVKAAYLYGNVEERKLEAITAVMADRIVGLYSLILLGTMTMLISLLFGAIPVDEKILALTVGATAGIGLGAYVFSRDFFLNLKPVKSTMRKLPTIFQRVIAVFKSSLSNPKLIFSLIGLSLLNHLFVIVSFTIGAFLLKDSLAAYMYFVINPIAMLMNAIPVTPGGIGITESAFSFLYESAGSPSGAAVGLLGRLIQYIVFFMGGTISIFYVKIRAGDKNGDTR